jgi:hypothetical protein
MSDKILALTFVSKGEGYEVDVYKFPDGHREFKGDMDCDVDGAPFWHNDPTGQAETTLRIHGKSIDSSVVCGIVLPPECVAEPAGIVMGCKAEVEWRGKVVPCVVFDGGPHRKAGEGSYAALKALGAPALKNGNGGIDGPEVIYRYWPGVPAVLDGVEYPLQAMHNF